MRALIGMLAVVSLGSAACRDQEAECRRADERRASFLRHGQDAEWVRMCVRESWTDRQMECYANGTGSFLSLFCAAE